MGWRNRRYCKHLAAAGITEKNRTSEGEASLRGSPDEWRETIQVKVKVATVILDNPALKRRLRFDK
jgi:hypothetical protein